MVLALRNLINDWKPKSETFFLRWSTVGLTALSTVSACYVTSHYRGFMMLKHHGIFGTYTPSLLLSLLGNGLFRDYFLWKDLLEFRSKSAIDYNMKIASGQVCFAILLPIFISSFSSFHFAERKLTYKLPTLGADPKFWLKTFARATQPALGRFIALAALNFAASSLLTHLEARQLGHVLQTVYELRHSSESVGDTSQQVGPHEILME